jgi:threonylcarbamoyladenosine tRNA methylthiotransferase MtaB
LGLSTDLIVGFPGEDEAEFAESYAFTAEMAFMKIHAFPYSVREGTPAAKLKGRVDPATAKERLGAIQALSEQGARAFADAHLGQTLPVIWEQIRGASEAGFWHQGWTDNYLRVEITHPADLTNSSTHVRLTEITESGSLVGTLVSEQG